MQGRYIEGDSFGEIKAHEIPITFKVTAGSRTMAIRKLLWAMDKVCPCPVMDIYQREWKGEISAEEAKRLEAEISSDDPREIVAHGFDWPEEFIELAMDDRLIG
jgi:hypothetical protein